MHYRPLLFTALALVASTSARAAYHEFTGPIRLISTSAPDLWGEWDYVLVQGFTSAGQCRLEAGYVLVRFAEGHSKAYASAMMAQASGKRVTVSLDDTRTDEQGYCLLRWIKVLE